MSHAADALAAFEGGDLEAALKELSELWQESRSPDAAEAIELVSARVAPPPAPPGKTVADRDAAWRKLEGELRPAVLGRLLETLLDVPTKWVAPRLAMLDSRWPDDPRTAMALARMMETTYAKGATTYRLWRGFCNLLARQSDPRTLDVLHRLDKAHRGDRAVAITRGLNRLNLFAKTAHVISQQARSFQRELTKEERAAVAKIRDAFASQKAAGESRAKTADDFLEEIYANPVDDGLRQVFADFLLESGDPRGELINLQLAKEKTAAAQRRESQLLRQFERTWLGAIEPVVLKDGLEYERGFAARVRTKCKSARLAQSMVGRKEWSTIREIDLFGWSQANRLELVLHPVMRSLEAVHGAELAIVRVERELPWRTLTLQGGEAYVTGSIADGIGEIARCDRFPKLETLRFDATRLMPEAARVLWTGSIAKSLRELGVTLYEGWSNVTPRTAIDRWLREMHGTTQLERFTVAWDRADGWRLALERVDGKLSRLVARFEWPHASSPLSRSPQPPLEWLAGTIEGLALTRIDVHARKPVATGMQIERFRASFPTAEVVIEVPDPDARAKEEA